MTVHDRNDWQERTMFWDSQSRFIKGGGWDFSKMAVMGGLGIFTRNGEKPGMGG